MKGMSYNNDWFVSSPPTLQQNKAVNERISANQHNEHTNLLLKARRLSHKTPFMVTDLGIISNNIDRLITLLPQVDIYYAIKSNPDAQIIRTIDKKVAGYDIASLGEFEHLVALGISPERMLFSNPIKIPEHIQTTFEQGVRYFAFDSLMEINKLARWAPGSNVYLRLKVSDGGSRFPLSHKFGVNVDKAIDYLTKAKYAGLNPIGLAFHVGSQSDNHMDWELAFAASAKIIKSVANMGIHLNTLNIGGGIPAEYGQGNINLAQIAQAIVAGQTSLSPQVRIVAEPGRSLAATSSIIVASVIGKEKRQDSADWLYLDMGVFQGLMEPLQFPSWRYPVHTDYDEVENRTQKYVLTGPSCDAHDTIGLDYILPIDLDLHDRIYIASAGAYTIVYASNFNGFNPPQIYYTNNAE